MILIGSRLQRATPSRAVGLQNPAKDIVTTRTFIYTLIYTDCVERMAGNGSRSKRETDVGTLRVEVPGTKGKRKWVA
jgi:hypothetical protein